MISARAMTIGGVLGAAVLVGGMGGCATAEPPAAQFGVAPGRYAEAFEAAQESLRELRFEIDRVDARAGVITTLPKTTGGLGTPWDWEQESIEQEWEDFTNLHDRRVRITFEPRGGGAEPPPGGQATTSPGDEDLRRETRAIVGRIVAVVERTRRPGWRIDPTAIMLGTHATDPDLSRRGMTPTYTEPIGEDRYLAARLAKDVRKRLGAESGDAEGAP